MATADMEHEKVNEYIKPLIRVNITISPELYGLIEKIRGDEERTIYIEKVLRESPRIIRAVKRLRWKLLPRRGPGRKVP